MTGVTPTFFWYDLETSGIDPRGDRIMQFAGQRTNLALEPVGDPVNILIKMNEDVLPQPDAILLTGITPQMTLADGVTEVEFLKTFTEEIATPGTIFVGFNSVRFDDEFMRFLHWRNFFDAYGWQWRDQRSRWDLLDVVRMTRALRPSDIEWPEVDGKATNRLELITKANGLTHEQSHDALSDVMAAIEVAKLIKSKQPKLFDYLLKMRDKKLVAGLVERGEPFVYSSGKYDGEFHKTTVAVFLATNPNSQGSLVYDLRHDPTEFLGLSVEDLVERWRWTKDKSAPARLPIKTLQYNRCPAVAPLSVLDENSLDRIKLDMQKIARHRQTLRDNPDFVERILEALNTLEEERRAKPPRAEVSVDQRLYDSFVGDADTSLMGAVRAASPDELSDYARDFRDERLRKLLPLYKARNYPAALSEEERAAWEAHRHAALMDGGVSSRLARFMHRLQELANQTDDRADRRYLLEELQLYAESIMPTTE